MLTVVLAPGAKGPAIVVVTVVPAAPLPDQVPPCPGAKSKPSGMKSFTTIFSAAIFP